MERDYGKKNGENGEKTRRRKKGEGEYLSRRVRAAPCPINLVQRDRVQQSPRRLACLPLRPRLSRHARRARTQTCNSRCQVRSAHLITCLFIPVCNAKPAALTCTGGTARSQAAASSREEPVGRSAPTDPDKRGLQVQRTFEPCGLHPVASPR